MTRTYWDHVLIRIETVVHAWLLRYSIGFLRVSMGLIFVGFGVLKLFPGVSPAQDLVEATIAKMTFEIMPGELGLVITALLEIAIGLSLITTRRLRFTMYLLIGELIGILSPVILLPGRLFSGPFHAPTLEGQYVLKDIVLVAAAMVVATRFRGTRLVVDANWAPGGVVSQLSTRSPVRRPSRGATTGCAEKSRSRMRAGRAHPPYDGARGRAVGSRH